MQNWNGWVDITVWDGQEGKSWFLTLCWSYMTVSGCSNSAPDIMPVQIIRIKLCLHPQPACVCSAPGCCSRTEYWSAEPACRRDLHILALKMQLIRCQIYTQATDLEFFKGMDAGHWQIPGYSPSFCLCTAEQFLVISVVTYMTDESFEHQRDAGGCGNPTG